jgi:acyl carrier protein
MNTAEILIECNKIFIDQLEDSTIAIKRETTSNDVEGWDSLTHIQLIVAIEKRFNIRFSASEIQNFENVGQMCDNIEIKIKNKQ